MAGQVNYKQKYEELKSKFMNSVDAAYRLGFEDGAKQAEMNQAQQQAQQEAEMAQAQANGMGQEGQSGQEGAPQEAQSPDSVHPEGTELDQHIAQLEGMLGKSENNPEELRKAVEAIKSFQNTIRKANADRALQTELKKSAKAIPAIAQALHKPAFKMSSQAKHNLNDTAKSAVTMQHKIVSDVMKSWSEQENRVGSEISKILNLDGVTKKD